MLSSKVRDEKPSTSSSIVGCCQSSSTTPENSIVDFIEEDITESSNNNTLFHASSASNKVNGGSVSNIGDDKKMNSINFTFPKRPKVDIEFQNVKYTLKQFSFKKREFGEYLFVLKIKKKEMISPNSIIMQCAIVTAFQKWVIFDKITTNE